MKSASANFNLWAPLVLAVAVAVPAGGLAMYHISAPTREAIASKRDQQVQTQPVSHLVAK